MTLEGCFVGLFRDLKTNLTIFWKEKGYLSKTYAWRRILIHL